MSESRKEKGPREISGSSPTLYTVGRRSWKGEAATRNLHYRRRRTLLLLVLIVRISSRYMRHVVKVISVLLVRASNKLRHAIKCAHRHHGTL